MCRAVYLYDNADKYTIRPWQNEERKLINRGNDITQGMAVQQSLINCLGKKEKKTQGIRIWSPSQLLTPCNRA